MENIKAIVPDELIDDLIPGFERYEVLSDTLMSKVTFYERSLSQWIDHLAIDIPANVTPEDLRNLFVRVAKNLQQASYFYSVCSTFNTTLASKADEGKAGVVTLLVNDYAEKNARRPAAQVLNQLAETYVTDV